jgi:hypothetical protein
VLLERRGDRIEWLRVCTVRHPIHVKGRGRGGGGRWEEHDEAGGRCWKEKGVTAVCD